jgi:hypothetical protein
MQPFKQLIQQQRCCLKADSSDYHVYRGLWPQIFEDWLKPRCQPSALSVQFLHPLRLVSAISQAKTSLQNAKKS